MNTATCPEHNKELKAGKYGRLYCPTPITKSANGTRVLEWCPYNPTNAPASTAPVPLPGAKEQVREAVNDWIPVKQKENAAMLKMSALKAASEVVAAEFGRPDHAVEGDIDKYTLEMADKFLKWLKVEDEV